MIEMYNKPHQPFLKMSLKSVQNFWSYVVKIQQNQQKTKANSHMAEVVTLLNHRFISQNKGREKGNEKLSFCRSK